LTVGVVLALAAFAAVVTLSVYVLLPKRSIFWLDTESIYPDLAPYADDRRLIDRNLARLYRELRALNEPTVTRLGRALTASAGALLLEIVLLAFGVA
jgi:hypothetical protein